MRTHLRQIVLEYTLPRPLFMKTPIWIKKNILLKKYNTFGLETKAKYFVKISSKDKLIKTLQWAKENSLPFFILGNGSNILFLNKEFPGIIIKIENNRIKKINQNKIVVGAGMMLKDLLKKCIKENWTGLEWVSGIPGTVGGAVFCNAGGFGYDIGGLVKKVITIDPKTYQEKIYSLKDCKFKYRDSIFKKKKEIIWEVELLIKKGKKEGIIEKAQECWDYKAKRNLFKYPSAGSVFKNVFAKEVLNKYKKGATIKGGKISVGWFIDQCNLKGKKIGGAMISPYHANVIININKAKGKNILDLIKICKEKVYQKFKIKLKEEIIVIHY
jgi:UDP-N-acetylmuramate dehydrogenase